MMKNKPNKKKYAVFLAVLFLITPPDIWAEDFPEKVKKPVKNSIEIRQATQREEDLWAVEKQKLDTEYKSLLAEKEDLLAENKMLQKEAKRHQNTIADAKQKITALEQITKELRPYLGCVYTQLVQSVSASPPFLQKERQMRLKRLGDTIDNPEISVNEKFRKLLEALQIEAEYGTSVEVYRELIDFENNKILVNIFRLGRLSLFFQTLDRKTSVVYNPVLASWDRLPAEFNREIGIAIDIAKKRRAAALLLLPIGKVVAQ